jgi:predicted alpha/beta-hydrolase family hydrolase
LKHFERELVRGFLHEPEHPNGNGLVITHGAGSNSDTTLLRAVAEAFAAAGVLTLRCDLPFRQQRPKGPPFPAQAERDREGLRRAVEALREVVGSRVFLGGHSYGGRQATMLAAEEPGVADALLLLSYPLHPPRKPQQLRTGHFGSIQTPALFIHGTRDTFGTVDEMRAALALIPARTDLLEIEGAGHSLHPSVAALCVQRLSVL